MEEELDNVNIDSKKSTEKNRKKSIANVAKIKKIASKKKDKEARLNRKADRIAARKGLEGSGVFNEDGNPDNESLMKARKQGRKIIDDRKAARKQYLRNFASQLARGEQATPSRSFGEGGPSTGLDLSKKAEQDQQSSDAADIKSAVGPRKAPNEGLGLDSFSSLSNIGNNLDSNPSSYLNKEYLSKRFGKINF